MLDFFAQLDGCSRCLQVGEGEGEGEAAVDGRRSTRRVGQRGAGRDRGERRQTQKQIPVGPSMQSPDTRGGVDDPGAVQSAECRVQ